MSLHQHLQSRLWQVFLESVRSNNQIIPSSPASSTPSTATSRSLRKLATLRTSLSAWSCTTRWRTAPWCWESLNTSCCLLVSLESSCEGKLGKVSHKRGEWVGAADGWRRIGICPLGSCLTPTTWILGLLYISFLPDSTTFKESFETLNLNTTKCPLQTLQTLLDIFYFP